MRPLAALDEEQYVLLHERSVAHFEPWMPKKDPAMSWAQMFARELDRALKRRATGAECRLGAHDEDGRMIGLFSLSEIVRGFFQNAYGGWRVGAEFIGQGLATEGVRGMLDLAFAEPPLGLGLHRVQANVIPTNAPSLRVAEKAGMRREGLALRYVQIDGQWQDHVMFARTLEEHKFFYLDPAAQA